MPRHQLSPKAMNFVLQTLRDGVREASSGGGLTASSVVMAAPAASRSGHLLNSILFFLFAIKDHCKKVCFYWSHNQGLRQLFLTVP